MYPKHNQNKNHSQPMKILKKNLLKNISGGEKFTFTYTCNWPRIAKISTSQTWGSSKCQILYLLKIVSKLKKFILATNIFWCSGSLIALKNKRVLYYSLLSKLNLEHIHLNQSYHSNVHTSTSTDLIVPMCFKTSFSRFSCNLSNRSLISSKSLYKR